MLGGRQETGGRSVAGLVVVEAGAVKLSQVSQLRVRAITQPVLGLHPPHHTITAAEIDNFLAGIYFQCRALY